MAYEEKSGGEPPSKQHREGTPSVQASGHIMGSGQKTGLQHKNTMGDGNGSCEAHGHIMGSGRKV